MPDNPTSVSVAVHADVSGKPGRKLFDLISPGEFAAGHSFFEAPPGAVLAPNTSYVLVWRYNRGTGHRLQRTKINSEDPGARTDSSIADAFYRGNEGSLSVSSGGNSLKMSVYTEVPKRASFVEGGVPVPLSWFHIPDGAYVGYQFRLLFVTHRATKAMSGEIDDYNDWVQEEAGEMYSDPAVIQKVAPQFRAVVCTEEMDARTNTGMGGGGVPVHWLDGGWQDRATLVANSNSQFYGGEWVNRKWGAYVTGNSAYFHEKYMIWTGCDSKGVAHPEGYMDSDTGMVAVGTPRDRGHAPLGPNDPDFVGVEKGKYRPLYAISPIFTVGGQPTDKPRNVKGTVSGDTLTLSWDPPLHAGDISGYKLYQRSGSGWEKVRGTSMTASAWVAGVLSLSGYHDTQADSSLSTTTFEYGSTTYTVEQLHIDMTTNDQTDDPDLTVRISPIPPGDGRLPLTIEFLSGESFAVADLPPQAVIQLIGLDVVRYRWLNTGIALWADGEKVFFTLKDADGNVVMDRMDVQVSGDTTTVTVVDDGTYGVSAITEIGESRITQAVVEAKE